MNDQEVKIAHRILLDLLVEFHKFCLENDLKYYIIGGTLLGAVRHKGFIPWDIDADVAMPRGDYNKLLSIISNFPSKYYIQNIDTEKNFHTPKTKILVLGAKKDNPGNYVISAKTGLNLDIFPLDVPPSDANKRKIQRLKIKFFKFILILKLKMQAKPKSIKGKIKHVLRRFARIILLPISNRVIIDSMTKIMTAYNNTDKGYLCSMSSHYDYNKQVMKDDIYGIGQEIEFEGKILIAPDKVHEYLVKIYGDYMKLPPEEKRKAMYENLELKLDDSLRKEYLE
jgi:lipopolysaccharide cholinephosphotransferase